jgi:hypothetical protein
MGLLAKIDFRFFYPLPPLLPPPPPDDLPPANFTYRLDLPLGLNYTRIFTVTDGIWKVILNTSIIYISLLGALCALLHDCDWFLESGACSIHTIVWISSIIRILSTIWIIDLLPVKFTGSVARAICSCITSIRCDLNLLQSYGKMIYY